ncbi:MAG: hypothetical protein PW792_11350 [Acidobacteriaceae bacterium]|nr:hypothetical protein [Acidobacteriaceae bacterium]
MISLEVFSELLEVLYSAPLKAEMWDQFLDLLCKATDSSGAFLLCADMSLGHSIRSQGGVMLSTQDVEAYRDSYVSRDLYRIQVIRHQALGVVDLDTLMPRATLLASDLYRDILAPSDLIYPGLAVFTCELRRMEAISLWRSEAQGPMTAEATHILKLLYPHIKSALEIRRALGVSEDLRQQTSAIADASPTPTLLVSHDRTLLQANAAARKLLDKGEGVLLRNGQLHAIHRTSDAELRKLLAGFQTQLELSAAPRLSNPIHLLRASHRAPLNAVASPTQYAPGHHAVLLLITDPERPPYTPEDALRELYKLTPAEVDICAGLLSGNSLQEVAWHRKVSLGTVRGQLKNIFLKTATTSQSELTRLLMQLPVAPPETDAP